MTKLTLIFEAIMGFGRLLKSAFLALFVSAAVTNKEVAKQQKKEIKDAKKAGKRRNHIESLSDDDLDDGLRKPKSPKE